MSLFPQALPVPALYVQDSEGSYRPATGDELLAAAQEHLARQLIGRVLFDAPMVVRDYLRCRHATREYEVFGALFLDSQNRLIEARDLFRGTVSQTSVYPREVVRLALQLNAVSMIVFHNHPSGTPTPSRADENLTNTLKSALSLVDVRLLDHFIITTEQVASMAELGLM